MLKPICIALAWLVFASCSMAQAPLKPPTTRQENVTETLHGVEIRKQLTAVIAPVLIVVGADDFICSPQQAKVLHLNLKNSKLLLIEKAGHFPWLEQPEAFFEGVPAFLEAFGLHKQTE